MFAVMHTCIYTCVWSRITLERRYCVCTLRRHRFFSVWRRRFPRSRFRLLPFPKAKPSWASLAPRPPPAHLAAPVGLFALYPRPCSCRRARPPSRADPVPLQNTDGLPSSLAVVQCITSEPLTRTDVSSPSTPESSSSSAPSCFW